MDKIFYNGWEQIIRTLIVGVLAYACLIAILRISGKRTLSKMNAFDLVVTVALGSTLATILLNADVALAEGVSSLALLVVLQYLVAWSSVRASWVRKAVTGEPTLLAYRGKFLEQALKGERIAEEEVLAAIRAAGLADVEEAEAVVLETDGSVSVVQGSVETEKSSLKTVRTYQQ